MREGRVAKGIQCHKVSRSRRRGGKEGSRRRGGKIGEEGVGRGIHNIQSINRTMGLVLSVALTMRIVAFHLMTIQRDGGIPL